jgi:citrate synthase
MSYASGTFLKRRRTAPGRSHLPTGRPALAEFRRRRWRNTVAKLTIGDKTFEFPVLSGSVGPDVIDIRSSSTPRPACSPTTPASPRPAATDSAITYIDGDKGELLYRGYPIEQLADAGDYPRGLLPAALRRAADKAQRRPISTARDAPHHGARADALASTAASAATRTRWRSWCGVVGAMAAFYHDSTDINDPQQREIASIRMIAKIPTLAAMAYKYSVGQPFVYPKNDLDYAENFLRMCFGGALPRSTRSTRCSPRDGPDLHPARRPRAERLDLDRALAGSSGANPFACIAAGVACLWGPAHGGANEAALNMLEARSAPSTRFPSSSPRRRTRTAASA